MPRIVYKPNSCLLYTSQAVLLAPQVRNYLKNVTEKCAPLNIPVSSIDVVAYGLQDPEKVLNQIKKMLSQPL